MYFIVRCKTIGYFVLFVFDAFNYMLMFFYTTLFLCQKHS